MKNRNNALIILFMIVCLCLQSCERLKKKMEIRDRRINYLKSTIDSARNKSSTVVGAPQDTIKK